MLVVAARIDRAPFYESVYGSSYAKIAEIRRKVLDRVKEVEDWAAKLERANRLRSLADKFQTEKLSSSDGVIDPGWIRRAADWLDPTVVRRWDEADGPRIEMVE